MNDSEDLLPEELIDEALASLRSATPPEDLHQANMAVVHQALACRAEPVWWRRSVSIPIPVALAASVVLVLTTTSLLKPWVILGEIQQAAPVSTQSELLVDDFDSSMAEETESSPTWSVTRSYIHSLPSLVNSTNYKTSATEEKHDDS